MVLYKVKKNVVCSWGKKWLVNIMVGYEVVFIKCSYFIFIKSILLVFM